MTTISCSSVFSASSNFGTRTHTISSNYQNIKCSLGIKTSLMLWSGGTHCKTGQIYLIFCPQIICIMQFILFPSLYWACVCTYTWISALFFKLLSSLYFNLRCITIEMLSLKDFILYYVWIHLTHEQRSSKNNNWIGMSM